MAYSTTITKSGQITLVKFARELFGVKPGERVIVEPKKDKITITRPKTDEEFLAYLDSLKTEKDKELIKKHAGKTVSELKAEWAASPEGQAYFEEERKWGGI